MSDLRAAEIIRPFLLKNERVLWSGQPRQGLILSARDGLLIPFSLLWGGFAIAWNIGVWTMAPATDGVGIGFRLWGLPFLLIGLYIMIGRFFHDAAIRKNLHYFVTDQRVLVVRNTRSPKVSSVAIDRLPRLDLTERRDGTGTISFEAGSAFSFAAINGFGAWIPSMDGTVRFSTIAEPRRVYEIVRDQAGKGSR